MIEEFKNIKSGKKELKAFGLIMAAAFVVLGLLFMRRRGEFPATIAVLVVLFFVSSFWGHFILKPLHKIWMAFSIILGRITNTVILTILFYLVLLPTGFAVKLFKGDFLGLKFDKKRLSFWEKKTKITEAREYYEKQF